MRCLTIDTASILIIDPAYLASAARELGVDERVAHALVQRAVTAGHGVVYSLRADGKVNLAHDDRSITLRASGMMRVSDTDWIYNLNRPAPDPDDDAWRRERAAL